MGQLEGKVAVVTGAARGMGRSHALRLAQEGAAILAVDICRQIDSVLYPMSTPDDLATTARLVESAGAKVVTAVADVRDAAELDEAVEAGVAALGPVDIAVANAGIVTSLGDPGWTQTAWQDAIDVILTGTFNTIEAVLPSMLAAGRGGSIVLVGSVAGAKGLANSRESASKGLVGYTAAKHGVVGLMRIYANALAGQGVRVNAVHPGNANTPMVVNDVFATYMSASSAKDKWQNPMRVGLIEPEDVSATVLHLCSDAARYVTGACLPVDGGFLNG